MCPLCLSAGAMIAAGAGSTASLAALIFAAVRFKSTRNDDDHHQFDDR
jgi:hypothetical protein